MIKALLLLAVCAYARCVCNNSFNLTPSFTSALCISGKTSTISPSFMRLQQIIWDLFNLCSVFYSLRILSKIRSLMYVLNTNPWGKPRCIFILSKTLCCCKMMGILKVFKQIPVDFVLHFIERTKIIIIPFCFFSQIHGFFFSYA